MVPSPHAWMQHKAPARHGARRIKYVERVPELVTPRCVKRTTKRPALLVSGFARHEG